MTNPRLFSRGPFGRLDPKTMPAVNGDIHANPSAPVGWDKQPTHGCISVQPSTVPTAHKMDCFPLFSFLTRRYPLKKQQQHSCMGRGPFIGGGRSPLPYMCVECTLFGAGQKGIQSEGNPTNLGGALYSDTCPFIFCQSCVQDLQGGREYFFHKPYPPTN